MIISSGYNIAGPEVEQALSGHPEVVDSAVVGVPDEDRGTVVKAFVVLVEGADRAPAKIRELQEFVKQTISPCKYPREIEFLSALPRTAPARSSTTCSVRVAAWSRSRRERSECHAQHARRRRGFQARAVLAELLRRPGRDQESRNGGARAGRTTSGWPGWPTTSASTPSRRSPAGSATAVRRTSTRACSNLSPGRARCAHTRRVVVFATVHTAFNHRVVTAKQLATVDHVGDGRAGVNIVAGWNQPEYEATGIELPSGHDDRYAMAQEWWDHVRALWMLSGRVDLDGRFYSLKGVESEPKPVQGVLPVCSTPDPAHKVRTSRPVTRTTCS